MTLFMSDAALPGKFNPRWWRIPSWTAITVVSVSQTHGLTERIATGVLMVLGATSLQSVQARSTRLRQAGVLVCTVTGLAACFTAPQGLAHGSVQTGPAGAGWRVRITVPTADVPAQAAP